MKRSPPELKRHAYAFSSPSEPSCRALVGVGEGTRGAPADAELPAGVEGDAVELVVRGGANLLRPAQGPRAGVLEDEAVLSSLAGGAQRAVGRTGHVDAGVGHDGQGA